MQSLLVNGRNKRQTAKANQSGKATASNAKKSNKQSEGSHAPQPPPPKLPANVDTLDQKDVKLFMSGDSLIWKSMCAGAWISKVKGFIERSRSVATHGESQALRLVIARAWKDWCIDAGVPFDECPMQGLPNLKDE